MQQSTPQASSNAIMGQFSQQPPNIPSGYVPHPSPAFLQSSANFEMSNSNPSVVDSFAHQYHQIHLYPPPTGGMPPVELQQLNGTTMQPIGQQRHSPQPPIGQFHQNEITVRQKKKREGGKAAFWLRWNSNHPREYIIIFLARDNFPFLKNF